MEDIAGMVRSKAENYYEYIHKNLNADYSLSDIEEFASNPKLDKLSDNEEECSKLGLFISAAVNKVIKKGETVSINPRIPLNYLCYKLKDAEAYLGTGNNLIGCYTDNSSIYIGKLLLTNKNITAHTPSEVSPSIVSVVFLNAVVLYELSLGYNRKNSKIYINDLYYQDPIDDPRYKHAEYKLLVDYGTSRKEGNQVFLSEKFYNQHPIMFRISGVKKLKNDGV